jgi:hypothetical protein
LSERVEGQAMTCRVIAGGLGVGVGEMVGSGATVGFNDPPAPDLAGTLAQPLSNSSRPQSITATTIYAK